MQNGEENGQGTQVDMAERLGAYMPFRSAPPWCCSVLHLPIPRHRSMGEVLQAFSSIDLKLVCTDGHDGVVLDPWVHCQGLGALQLTLELHHRPNLRTCCLHNRLWEPTKALRSRGGDIQRWSAPLPCRPTPKFAPLTFYASYKYPHYLETL